MGYNEKGKEITEKFLIDLEEKAIILEEEMLSLVDINKQSRYLQDILDVLNVSKLAFAEGYNCLSHNKVKEFETIVTTTILNEEEIAKLIQETRNLYYLNVSNLIGREEVIVQQQQAEKIIGIFINRLEESLTKVDMPKNQQKISQSESRIEKIINIGDKFDDYKQTGAIEDITFFGHIIEESCLTDEEKLEFICQALTSNVNFYHRNPNERNKDLEVSIEEDALFDITAKDDSSLEAIDDLLAMLSSDEVSTENNNIKR